MTIKLDQLLLQQVPGGLTLVKPGDTSATFGQKLEELQREIQQLNMSCQRLRALNRATASRAVAGSDIRVVTDSVTRELGTLQGWLISAVESYFGLVWNELGSKEVDDVMRAWKRTL